MAVNFREKNKRVRNSLSDLGDLTALSSFQSEPVLELRASDAQLQSVDANSAHVVVTLDVVAAPAANPVPQPETKKEITMNATTTNNANATDAEVKPTAEAPAKPAGLGLTHFAPDFNFMADLGAANTRLHELGGAVGVLDGRMTEAERRIVNLEGRSGSGTMTVSEDQSWEHTGIKIATAAAVGAAVYTGVRLAQMAFGDGPTAE